MNKNNKIEEEVGITVGDNQKYIRFCFGRDYTFIIYIIEGDTCCDVYITKEKQGPITKTSCEKTPILKWAFDELKEEWKFAKFRDNADTTFYCTLSLFENNEEILTDSSKKFVTGNKKLKKKLYELRSYIFNELLIEKYSIPLIKYL